MATSGGGFAASGLLQGFAQSYNQAYQRRTQQDLEQRHQLASFLVSSMPNMRPEAQQDAAQRLLSIYSTPVGKKLDKKLSDFSTLGQGSQQAQAQAGQAGAASSQQGLQQGMAAPPTPPAQGGTPGAEPTAQPSIAGGIPQQAPPIPAPPPYNPLMSPQEHNQQAAAQIAAQTGAQETAKYEAMGHAFDARYKGFLAEGMDPSQAAINAHMSLGGNAPMSMFAPHALGGNNIVTGSDLLKENPGIKTAGGQDIDPKSAYTRATIVGKEVGVPAGLAGEQAAAKLEQTKAQTGAIGEKVKEFYATDAYRKWKERLDKDTQMRIAQMHIDATTNKAPAAMMQTAVFAGGALEQMGVAKAEMEKLKASGVLGSLPANKVEDWIFGKGAVDPTLPPDVRESIGKMRAALGYTATAAMRAHTGRTSQEIYKDFKDRLGPGQDWDALDGALDATQTLLTHYAGAASDSSIKSIRSGALANTPPPAQGQPNANANATPARPSGVPANATWHPDTRRWSIP